MVPTKSPEIFQSPSFMIERSLTLVYWARMLGDSVLFVISPMFLFIGTGLFSNALSYPLIFVCGGLLFVLILHY